MPEEKRDSEDPSTGAENDSLSTGHVREFHRQG